MRKAALGIGAIVAAVALATPQAGSAKAPQSFFGTSPQAPLLAEDYDRMAEARVGSLRFEIHWAAVNPSPGSFSWTGTDAIVREAAESGISLLPVLYATPQWVAELDGRDCTPSECLPYGPKSAAAMDAFVSFAREVAERYGRGGEFWAANPLVPERPLEVMQILNEQNSPTFYKPKPKVAKYAKLLELTDRAIGEIDPTIDIVLGGMFGTPLGGRKPALSSWKFLEKLYDVKGSKRWFDGVAPHPYASKLKKVRAQVELMRDEMKRAHDRNADLWVTEVGWASDGPSHPLNKGRQGQARSLADLYDFFLGKRRAWNVQTVTWFSWRDVPADDGICTWCPYSGLVDKDLEGKPSLSKYTQFTGGS